MDWYHCHQNYITFSFLMLLSIIAYLIYFCAVNRRAYRKQLEKRPSWLRLLLFTFAIIMIWAILTPNFFRYAACASSKEAQANLRVIYLAQLVYFSRSNTYAGGGEAFKLMNWDRGGHRYAYYCDRAVISNRLPLGIEKIPMPDEDWPVDLKPRSSQTGFTCMAVGNLDNDPELDVWAINNDKVLTRVFSDFSFSLGLR